MTDQNENAKILLPILREIPLFKDLDEENHLDIISHIILMYYPVDHQIFKEGEEGNALYIIKKGTISISRKNKETEREDTLAVINPNGFFGEMALISDIPRNATAKTLEDCEVFVLNKEDFKTLMKTNITLAEQISAAIVERLNRNDKTQY